MHGWQALNKLSKIETETLFPGAAARVLVLRRLFSETLNLPVNGHTFSRVREMRKAGLVRRLPYFGARLESYGPQLRVLA